MAQPLLEPVAAGQTRFRMQGLSPDARGVAVGREVVIMVASLDRLISFLGAYSEEGSLDDLISTLTLERVQREAGGQAFALRCAAGDAYHIDRLARLAAATQGRVYTGAGAVFLRWRDRSAPFGYDLSAPLSARAEELLLVDTEVATNHRTLDRIDPVELIQRLQLRAVPLPVGGIGQDIDACGLRELALVLVAPGLANRMLAYLWRLEIPMAGYHLQLAGDRQPSLLLRLRQPKPRLLEVLHGTPGVELLAPVSPRAAVEVGYRHPIHLASASACFPGEEMFLFRGTVSRVERLEVPPRFIDARHLVESTMPPLSRALGPVEEAAVEPLRVQLRLQPSSFPREPRATLIEWSQAALLRKLVYLIPPSSLTVARVALLQAGILVLTGAVGGSRSAIASAGLGAGAIIPLGRRYWEAAPGVLVPDGLELWPVVRAPLLRELLGLDVDDHAVFFDAQTAPVRLRASDLLGLDAALMARLPLTDPELLSAEAGPTMPKTVHHARLGRFALWGTRAVAPDVLVEPERLQLAASRDESDPGMDA